MLYLHGLGLGFKALMRGGHWKTAKSLLKCPVNHWRFLEFRLAVDEGRFKPGERVLDIGSPKLLSLHVAKRLGCTVHSTDIEDYFIEEQEFLRDLAGISADRLINEVQDGRKLTYEDDSFDKIYSISVIEHIPDGGDSECMAEIKRVLKPGGRVVITVPFRTEYEETFRDADKFYWADSSVENEERAQIFYERSYDEAALRARLIDPSGLKLVKLQYIGQRFLTKSGKDFSENMPNKLGFIQPLTSKLMLMPPNDDWKALKLPLAALLVLEK